MKKLLILTLVTVMVVAVAAVVVIAADPGTQTDPLISKSYVDNVLKPEIYEYVDAKASEGFVVVNVPKGKTVICGAGTEMILRMGSAEVIGSARGGIADVTMGVDLADGIAVPSNHMLIVPLDDGRGVKIDANTEAILMIKGKYTIK